MELHGKLHTLAKNGMSIFDNMLRAKTLANHLAIAMKLSMSVKWLFMFLIG